MAGVDEASAQQSTWKPRPSASVPSEARKEGVGVVTTARTAAIESVEDRRDLISFLRTVRKASGSRGLLALGTDLTSLGLNLNSHESLCCSLISPTLETQPPREEVEYYLPQCYYINPLTLKISHFQKFAAETLFYIFYTIVGDVLQGFAAVELFSRGWRYHVKFQKWFIPLDYHAKSTASGGNAAGVSAIGNADGHQSKMASPPPSMREGGELDFRSEGRGGIADQSTLGNSSPALDLASTREWIFFEPATWDKRSYSGEVQLEDFLEASALHEFLEIASLQQQQQQQVVPPQSRAQQQGPLQGNQQLPQASFAAGRAQPAVNAMLTPAVPPQHSTSAANPTNTALDNIAAIRAALEAAKAGSNRMSRGDPQELAMRLGQGLSSGLGSALAAALSAAAASHAGANDATSLSMPRTQQQPQRLSEIFDQPFVSGLSRNASQVNAANPSLNSSDLRGVYSNRGLLQQQHPPGHFPTPMNAETSVRYLRDAPLISGPSTLTPHTDDSHLRMNPRHAYMQSQGDPSAEGRGDAFGRSGVGGDATGTLQGPPEAGANTFVFMQPRSNLDGSVPQDSMIYSQSHVPSHQRHMSHAQ